MTINNNIKIIKNNKFQTARFGCFFRLPLTQENLSYMTLLALYQGNVSSQYPSMKEQASCLAELYDINLSIFPQVRGNQIIFQFQLEWVETSLITDQSYTLTKVVKLIRNILLQPLLNDVSGQMLKLTKNELLDEIDEFFDAPDNVAFYDFYQNYYSDRPAYSATLFGDLDLLKTLTLDQLAQFHAKMLQAPAFIVGTAKDTNKLTALIKQEIVPLIPGLTSEFSAKSLQIAANNSTYQELTRKFGAQQSQLFLGYAFTNPPDNKWISNVFTQYLGGDESSVLFQNVREKLGAAYAIDALNYNDNNLLVVTAGLQKDKLSDSRVAIKNEISKIAQGKIKDTALAQAKSALLRQRKMMLDQQRNILIVVLNDQLRGRSLSPVVAEKHAESSIAAVTAESLAKFAQQLILKESYILE